MPASGTGGDFGARLTAQKQKFPCVEWRTDTGGDRLGGDEESCVCVWRVCVRAGARTRPHEARFIWVNAKRAVELGAREASKWALGPVQAERSIAQGKLREGWQDPRGWEDFEQPLACEVDPDASD